LNSNELDEIKLQDKVTYDTGKNLALAMKLPMYPAAACLRIGGWLGPCNSFHKWSKKASAKPWKKRKSFWCL